MIFIGTKTILIDGKEWEYTGEIDVKGKACGIGKAIRQESGQFGNMQLCSFIGTFYNDLVHGLGKYIFSLTKL